MRQSMKWVFSGSALALALVLGMGGAVRAQAEGKATISGTVTAEDGSAAAGIEVRVIVPPSRGPRDGEGAQRKRPDEQAAGDKKKPGADRPERPEPVATATTDADGKFSVEVAAGDYVIMAGKPGAGMGRERVSVAAGETKNVDLKLKKGPRGEGAPKRPGKGKDAAE